ncbi:MAG: hypothetical protein JSW54_13500 [Fidelibacterota bacterium]|nr:MAG: hypothetical protein JSW54_13500 [Candidatus Neomarinimicrobiota bacterium]
MRKLSIILLCSVAGLAGQSITRVDFEILPGNLVEVTYSIYDPDEPNAVYAIDLYASLDGGYAFPIHAQSVTGDVGPRVVGSGRKGILWKVLEDVPALVSDNLVIKVVGRTRPSISGFFRSLVAGNRFTKRLSNGITFYGGGGNYYVLQPGDFQAMLEDGSLLPRSNTRFGLRVTSVPFVYRFNGLYRNWDLELSDEGELQRLEYLSYTDAKYGGENILLHYFGLSVSMAYTPLPVFGIFLPQIGGGLSFHQMRLGNKEFSLTSSLNNPSVFAEIGVQVNLLRWIKLNAGARQNFLGPNVNFTETFLEIGLHISTTR